MSELSTQLGVPYQSGLSINGVPVPLALEGADAPHEERVAAISAFVSDFQAKGADVALVRAHATLTGGDPNAAESTLAGSRAAAAAPEPASIAPAADAAAAASPTSAQVR